MTEYLQSISLFPLFLTFGAYQIGVWCHKKTRSSLCNPLLIATIICIVVLLLTKFDLQLYLGSTTWITWLLTPATVCFAVPLYVQLKAFKNQLGAILTGVVAGSIVSLGFVGVVCVLLKLDTAVTVSLLPKSITTAIGTVLAEQNGGIASLTSTAIAITGIFGNLAGTFLCKLFKITDPIAQGVGFGTASHVMGTSRATEINPLTGAVSSLSLVIAGILTSLLFPLVCKFI